MTGIHKLVGILPVKGFTFALAIGSMWSADMDSFVELYSAPFEGFNDIILCARDKPSLIGILDPQDKFPAGLPGKKVIIQGCPDTTNVQGTGRAWRKSYSDFSHKSRIYTNGRKDTKQALTLHLCPSETKTFNAGLLLPLQVKYFMTAWIVLWLDAGLGMK